MSTVLPRLVDHPGSCTQSFELIKFLMLKLWPKLSPVLDLPRLAEQCTDLLLELNSTEVCAHHWRRRIYISHANLPCSIGRRGF